MIFDLKSGKRRHVVQVIFGILAFIFFISFVGFGIGSNATGGIFDAIGLGGDDNTSSNPQYDQQIEDAESALAEDPKDQVALINLVRYSVLSAREGVSTDETSGTRQISEDARTQLERAADAWSDYLKTKPDRPNASAAVYAAEAFSLLGDPGGAASAQRVVAEKQGSSVAYNQLAIYLYSDGKIAAGDAAGDRAVEAADPAQRGQVEKSMDQLAKLARKYKKQLAEQQSAPGSAGQGLENPFGGLGGGAASGAAPASP